MRKNVTYGNFVSFVSFQIYEHFHYCQNLQNFLIANLSFIFFNELK